MDIPTSPGTYVLVLYLDQDRTIPIGRLGEFLFRAGYYLYVGSARGPGGLRARLERHLRGGRRLHWHIDFLRYWTQPVEIWYNTGTQHRECSWREALQQAGFSLSVPRFGALDCQCPGHLLYTLDRPEPPLLLGATILMAGPPA